MSALSPKATSETSLTPDPAGPADQGVHKLSALAEFLASAIDEGMAFSISDLRNAKSLQRAIRRCVALADPQKVAACMTGATMVLAPYYAKQAVKQELRREGLRPHEVAVRSWLTDQIVRAIIR